MSTPKNGALRCFFLKMQGIALLSCQRPQGALQKFERMLQLQPNHRYALASCAHVQAQLGHVDAAIAHLQQLTNAWPADAPAWFNLAYVLQQANQHAQAESAFRSALALDERLDRAWYGLAMVLIQAQRFDEAVQALKKNTALQPMSPYGWYRLAETWLAVGKPEEARKVLRHLRQFEPKVAAQLSVKAGFRPR